MTAQAQGHGRKLLSADEGWKRVNRSLLWEARQWIHIPLIRDWFMQWVVFFFLFKSDKLSYCTIFGNHNFTLLRQQEGERPSQIVTDTKYKTSGHFLLVPLAWVTWTSVPTALMLQGWYRLWDDTLLSHIRALPDSSTALGTNSADRSQIYLQKNLLTLPSPKVLMLMFSSSIKMQLNNKIKVPILFIFLFLNKLRLEMGCKGFHCYSWHFANIQLWIMDK